MSSAEFGWGGGLKAACVAIAVISMSLMSVMVFSVSQGQIEPGLIMFAQKSDSNDTHEEILNNIKMLQKQFDMIESSIGKVDEFETNLQRMTDFMSTLPEYTVFLAKQGSNESGLGVRKLCDFNEVRGAWSDRWKWLNDGCEVELSRDQLMRCVNRFGKIALMGDSQTSRVYHSLVQSIQSQIKCKVLKQGKRCGQVDGYFGLPPVPVRSRAKANPKALEGPIAYGKSHPGCTDCSGCNGQLTECPATNSSSAVGIEYLPVEFARDVELQSPAAGTTQEVAALYLSRSRPPPGLVIFNSGIHDNEAFKALQSSETHFQELYRRNLAWYLHTLEANLPNSTFVFMTTTPYRPGAEHAAVNARIGLMNAAAGEVVRARGHTVLDVHPLLGNDKGSNLFTDKMHASAEGGAYYKAVVYLLARRLCGDHLD